MTSGIGYLLVLSGIPVNLVWRGGVAQPSALAVNTKEARN
jgi:hypothetical protein